MAIYNYPDQIQKNHHVVESLSNESKLRSVKGAQDLTGNPLAFRFSPGEPFWKAKLISLKFGASTSKAYSVNVEYGRGIIKDSNDSLWIDIDSSGWAQRIVLAPGFYNGTELSAQVKAALEANTIFNDLGLTFTVTYSSSTDLFTITPSSGTIQYLNLNPSQNLRRNSTAGHVLGLTADQSGSSLVSDTVVPGLGVKTLVTGETGTATNIVVTSEISLSVDEAISIDVSAVSTTVDYCLNYTL